jgi:hypothetical protein
MSQEPDWGVRPLAHGRRAAPFPRRGRTGLQRGSHFAPVGSSSVGRRSEARPVCRCSNGEARLKRISGCRTTETASPLNWPFLGVLFEVPAGPAFFNAKIGGTMKSPRLDSLKWRIGTAFGTNSPDLRACHGSEEPEASGFSPPPRPSHRPPKRGLQVRVLPAVSRLSNASVRRSAGEAGACCS